MKLVFDRQPLASGLSLIQNIVSSTTTMPIISNILIEAEGESATITGTDLESFGRVTLQARVEESGRATVSARLLGDIVKLLPEGEVMLETTGGRLAIQCGRNNYQLATMPADDYPKWPDLKAETTIRIKQQDLKRAMHNTMFAIPVRDPRKVLMGMLVEITEEHITCVATDGRKLGKCIISPLGVEGETRNSAIIPQRILQEIDRAIGEEGEIEITLTERQILFNLSNLSYISNCVEGNYPKYESVIPESFVRSIKINKTVLADAISRAAVLAERKYHSIILQFADDQIEITSKSFEDGSYEGSIEAEYKDEPFRIAFNHHYLQEILKVTPDTELEMKVKDNSAPVVFETANDPDSLFLIMPVRMAELNSQEPAATHSAEL
jgi:DNA polymerase-3 subunit beta